MASLFESCAPTSIIAAIRASTIDGKRHTATPDDERKSWAGSSRPCKRNAFSLPTIKSTRSSAHAAIIFLLYHIVTPEKMLSSYGKATPQKSRREFYSTRPITRCSKQLGNAA